MLPFSLAMILSMIGATVICEPVESGLSVHTLLGYFWNAVVATFSITIFTSMWVAFRGSNRRFYPSMGVRVSMVGLLCPVVVICIWTFFASIGYGTPTLASPGLETLLVSSALLGEMLVRFASQPADPLLETTE